MSRISVLELIIKDVEKSINKLFEIGHKENFSDAFTNYLITMGATTVGLSEVLKSMLQEKEE